MGNLVNIGKIIPATPLQSSSPKRWNHKHKRVFEMMKTFSVLSFSDVSLRNMVLGPLKDLPDWPKRDFMKLFSGFGDSFQGYLRLQLSWWRLCQLLGAGTGEGLAWTLSLILF